MLGLVCKDFYNLAKYLRTMLIAIVLFGVYAVLLGDVSIFSVMALIYPMMSVLSTFSYDNYSKFDTYGLCMPLKRSQFVGARYLLTLILLGLSTLLNCAAAVLAAERGANLGEVLLPCYVYFALGMLLCCVMIPVVYRFGVERSRLIVMALFLIPSIGFLVLFKSGGGFTPSEQAIRTLLYASPLLLLAALGLSFLISRHIFAKKEF